MGWIKHNAIIVTGWDAYGTDYSDDRRKKNITSIHKSVVDTIGKEWVSELSPEYVNGYRSFCVFPDGSKEGWEASDKGDSRRDSVVQILTEIGYTDWVEVEYGETEPGVTRSNRS